MVVVEAVFCMLFSMFFVVVDVFCFVLGSVKGVGSEGVLSCVQRLPARLPLMTKSVHRVCMRRLSSYTLTQRNDETLPMA